MEVAGRGRRGIRSERERAVNFAGIDAPAGAHPGVGRRGRARGRGRQGCQPLISRSAGVSHPRLVFRVASSFAAEKSHAATRQRRSSVMNC
jgi:hypothetical protein